MSSTNYINDKGALIGITIAFIFLVLVDLIGNSLVIAIIFINRSMRTPMNYLLINLAVADMMVGVFIAAGFVISPFLTHPDGLTGTVLCKLLTGGVLMWVGSGASVFSLFAVCFERYFAVVHPLSLRLKLTVKKVKIIVVFCWLFSAFSIFAHFLAMDYDKESQVCMERWHTQPTWMLEANVIYWLIVFGVLPIITMFILYSRVIYKLWFKQEVEGTQLAVLRSRKRITKIVITVSIIYGLTWLPNLVIYALVYNESGFFYGDVTYICSLVLVTCNSAVNPFVYTLQSEKFRRHVWKIVSCKLFHNNGVVYNNKGNYSLPRTK